MKSTIVSKDGDIYIPSAREMRLVLESAIKAPSYGNMQPWRFELENECLHLIDPHRFYSSHNIQNMPVLISLGAVLKNIREAGMHLGLYAEVTYFPEDSNDYFVASVKFRKSEFDAQGLFEQISRRRTNRLPYSRTKIDEEHIEGASFFFKNTDTFDVSIVSDHSKKNRLANIIQTAEDIAWSNTRIRNDRLKQFHFGEEVHGEGICLSEFPLSSKAEVYLRLYGKYKFVRLFPFLKIFSLQQKKTILTGSSHLGVISMDGQSKKAYLSVGEQIQAFWLELTRSNIDLQPLCLINYLMMIYKLKVDTVFSESEILKLKSLTEEFYNIFDLEFRKTPVFLFRIGERSSEYSSKSNRKELYSFCEKELRRYLSNDS